MDRGSIYCNAGPRVLESATGESDVTLKVGKLLNECTIFHYRISGLVSYDFTNPNTLQRKGYTEEGRIQ